MESTITLPDKVPSWNKMYAGVHWAARKKEADDWHNLIFFKCKELKIPKYKSADITIISTSKRPLDPDNICAKLIIDGLVHAGVLPDDSYKYVESVLLMSTKGKEEETIIRINGNPLP